MSCVRREGWQAQLLWRPGEDEYKYKYVGSKGKINRNTNNLEPVEYKYSFFGDKVNTNTNTATMEAR